MEKANLCACVIYTMELCRAHRARLRCLAGRETRSTCTRNRGQRDGQRCVTARAVTEFLEWCATPLPNLSPPIMYTALELCCPLKTAAWNFEDEKIYAKKDERDIAHDRWSLRKKSVNRSSNKLVYTRE